MYVNDIIARILDHKKIIAQHPELVHLDKLSLDEKIELLIHPTPYSALVNINILTFNEKLSVLRGNQRRVIKKLDFTKEELEKLKGSDLLLVLQVIRKHLTAENFQRLSKRQKKRLLVSDPQKILAFDASCLKDLSGLTMYTLIHDHPQFVIDNMIGKYPIKEVSVSAWSRIIAKDKKYLQTYIESTTQVRPTSATKASIRHMIRLHPVALNYLTIPIIEKSCLNFRDWIYLFARFSDNVTILDEEFVNELSQGMTLELLNGKARLTKLNKACMAKLKAIVTHTEVAEDLSILDEEAEKLDSADKEVFENEITIYEKV